MAAKVHSDGPRFGITEVEPLFGVNLDLQRAGYYGYDVTPDGQRFLLESAGESQHSEVILVVNWPADLKRK